MYSDHIHVTVCNLLAAVFGADRVFVLFCCFLSLCDCSLKLLACLVICFCNEVFYSGSGVKPSLHTPDLMI